MTEFTDLETIVKQGLCVGCGLCASIAGTEHVDMGITSASRMRPRVRQPLDEDTMERVRAVCPGIALTGPDAAQVADRGGMHAVWGPIRTMHRGWSTNEDLRFRSAAGGATTALGCYLLETGAVDAIVQVRASLERPMETDWIVSRTVEEVRSGAQSRYGPAAPLVPVMDLLDEGVRFAVIAKPCDVAAIRNLARVDSRAVAQIPYLITFFCGGVPTLETARTIARHHGVADEDIAVFRWRGNGWPGPTRVETRDGRIFDLSYDKVWYSNDVPWSYDLQFRCKICPDAIGELADVSCPDSWQMADGRPIHEEAPGANLFIARTRQGEALVAAAAAAGAVHLDPFTIDELDAQHDDHVGRKIENPARVQALSLEGEPEPKFLRFRREELNAIAGKDRYAATLAGARRRIREGSHREPVA
jgi:coenzyme F420 hydrogenase subunit beta